MNIYLCLTAKHFKHFRKFRTIKNIVSYYVGSNQNKLVQTGWKTSSNIIHYCLSLDYIYFVGWSPYHFEQSKLRTGWAKLNSIISYGNSPSSHLFPDDKNVFNFLKLYFNTYTFYRHISSLLGYMQIIDNFMIEIRQVVLVNFKYLHEIT